jgi:hypothetical protein
MDHAGEAAVVGAGGGGGKSHCLLVAEVRFAAEDRVLALAAPATDAV